jgi:hypothetical protein
MKGMLATIVIKINGLILSENIIAKALTVQADNIRKI